MPMKVYSRIKIDLIIDNHIAETVIDNDDYDGESCVVTISPEFDLSSLNISISIHDSFILDLTVSPNITMWIYFTFIVILLIITFC